MSEYMKIMFPKLEEGLVNFLNWCKLRNSKFMLCLDCNVVYDEKTSKKYGVNQK